MWKGLEGALDDLILEADGGQSLDTTVDGLKVTLRLHDDLLAALRIWRAAARQRAVERLSGWAAAQEAACASMGQPPSSATYLEALRRVIQAEQGRRARVQAARDQAAALRQLFVGSRKRKAAWTGVSS